MARKTVYRMEHLRRMGNEGAPAWKTRKAVAKEVLAARERWPGCRFKLLQNPTVDVGRNRVQFPDFMLECKGGGAWAIEIGLTGTVRRKRLERAGLEVLQVGRGVGFNFEHRCNPCDDCPHT